MKEWIINGNKELSGTIEVGGAKNSLLAILPASIITKSIISLENVTPMKDTYQTIKILKKLNVRVLYDNKSKMIIDSRNVKNALLDGDEVKNIRASYYFMGSLLSLYKNVNVAGPGGCKFASRPIDLHLFVFSELGNKCLYSEGIYSFNKSKIKSRNIKFKKVSVGATINAILASCKVKGKIVLENVAHEPEVDDLINFLNCCGANIVRDGNKIIIRGVNRLHGCKYKIMEDRIEAGTYLILGACIGNNLKIKYHESKNLMALINLLINMGVDISVENDSLIVSRTKEIKDVEVVCDVYPSLATDLQQPLSILLSKTNKISILKDNVYPSRYTQIEDLKKMGFKMEVKDDRLYVSKSLDIKGEKVECKDLRGGISLVIAALIATNRSIITNVTHIERGYFNIVWKLKKIGAMIYEKA